MAGKERSEIVLAMTGMGMVTPVGYDAPTSCASIRADISGLEAVNEFPMDEYFKYDGNIVEAVGGRVKGLTDGHLGLSRFSRMALPAFKEAIAASGIKIENLSRVKFIIALPEIGRLGRDERIEKLLIHRMLKSIGITNNIADARYVYSGSASSFVALEMAESILEKNEAEQIIIGGVDSLLEPPTLLTLEKERRIRNDSNEDGYNPGEASFFLVVETEEHARERKADNIAHIQGVAVTREKNSYLSKNPSTGVGLSDAITKTLQSVDREIPINMVVCDMNGERYRGAEWGIAVVRTMGGVKGTLDLWHPADCIGETGAASGGISIILGASAIHKGYAQGKHVLVWASSDDGMRGSLIIKEPNE